MKDAFQKEIELSSVEGQRIAPTKAAQGHLPLLEIRLFSFQGKHVGIKAREKLQELLLNPLYWYPTPPYLSCVSINLHKG